MLGKIFAALKFLSVLDKDGYPFFLPVTRSEMGDEGRILIPLPAYGSAIGEIQPGAKAALFLAGMKLLSVLLQGTITGFEKHFGLERAVFDIDKVCNSIVPVTEYIRPEKEYEVVY
jgi:hypothetical protein